MKYWEMIADNLRKAGWSLGAQPLIPRGEQSGSLTHIATESGLLCTRMKSWQLFWNSNR
jgi:hypothetical protein